MFNFSQNELIPARQVDIQPSAECGVRPACGTGSAEFFPASELAGLMGLSVYEPWVWCMFHLPPRERKDVENRGWMPRPDHLAPGQLLVIQAAKTQAGFEETRDLIERRQDVQVPPKERLVFGALIGVVRFLGATRNAASRWAVPGQCHWRLGEARRLQAPVAYRGEQRLFRIQKGALL